MKAKRHFYLLTVNQFFIQLAHATFDISIIWLSLDITGSNMSTGILMATAYLPFLIFSLPAGIIADRRSKTALIKVSSFFRIAIALIIPIYALGENLNIFIVGIAAFLLTSFAAVYIPARDALIPEYLPENKLFFGNSIIQGSVQISYVLGPIIAGFMLDYFGNITTFFTISFFFFMASLLSLALKKSGKNPQMKKSAGKEDILEIIRIMKKDKRLSWLIAITMMDNLFIMGPAIVGVAIFVREVLNGGASQYALCETSLAAGMIVSTLLLIRFGKSLPLGKMLIVGIFFDGATYIPLIFIHSIRILWLMIFIHALFIPLITVSRTTMVQKLVPAPLHGRFFSLMSISVVGFTAISSAFTGWAAEVIPIAQLFLYIGIGASFMGIIAWFYKPLRVV